MFGYKQKPPCKFYPNCRKGNSCQFSHEKSNGGAQALTGTVGATETVANFTNQNTLDNKANQIKQDMKDYKSFAGNVTSSYGLAHPAVNNLIDGRDLSFEELRLKYNEAMTGGGGTLISDYEREMDMRQRIWSTV